MLGKLKKMILPILVASSIVAAHQTVVFDWGKVMANPNGKAIVGFLCETFQMSEEELERTHLQFKRERLGNFEPDATEFWLRFAEWKGTTLPSDWPAAYNSVAREALNPNLEMYALVGELKAKGVPVALLSNIEKPHGLLIRGFGFYDPFDPCLLSYEIGVRKPDPKAYLHLLDALGLPGEDVIFFDDKLENVEAARKLGIDAIQFESFAQVQKELVKRGLFD